MPSAAVVHEALELAQLLGQLAQLLIGQSIPFELVFELADLGLQLEQLLAGQRRWPAVFPRIRRALDAIARRLIPEPPDDGALTENSEAPEELEEPAALPPRPRSAPPAGAQIGGPADPADPPPAALVSGPVATWSIEEETCQICTLREQSLDDKHPADPVSVRPAVPTAPCYHGVEYEELKERIRTLRERQARLEKEFGAERARERDAIIDARYGAPRRWEQKRGNHVVRETMRRALTSTPPEQIKLVLKLSI